jgi:membrane protease YdiL (CAAX protease family)
MDAVVFPATPQKMIKVGSFLVLTFALTWLPWGVLALSGQPANDPTSPRFLLFLLGGFGPTLAGLLLTFFDERGAGLRRLWRSTRQIRFGLGWWLVICLLFPAVNGLVILVQVLLGSPAPDLSTLRSLLAQPLSILPFAISVFVFGPLAEEYGWRGYALERVQAQWGTVRGSLSLGAAWAMWHWPLFFMAGIPQHDSGQSFWLFTSSIIVLSLIFTWVYNGTRRSMAAMLLLHFVYNFSNTVLPGGQSLVGLFVLSAIALVVYAGRGRSISTGV